MKKRELGRTGISVSEIALGCRWLNKGGAAVLKAAREAGITHLDTAAGYSGSEQIIGEYLQESGWNPVISSKVWASEEGAIRTALEKSLKLLNRQFIDIYLIHNPVDTEKALPVFLKLKSEGLIKAVGICGWHGDGANVLKFIDTGDVDVIQIALTIAHRSMVDGGVIAAAAKKNVGVQVMSPMAKGLLTGEHPVLAPLAPYGIKTLEQASFRYILDNVEYVTILPGTSKPDRISEFASVSEMKSVPVDLWEKVLAAIDGNPELQKLP
ncbi:MAG: aldo/keto reductase [Fibrobacteres bacterium]|nr:aldo/keto reductase [Fibrobacterota bacterium]